MLCVKIDPPIDTILQHAQKSTFCFGVWGKASGLSLADTILESIKQHTDYQKDLNWLSANKIEEVRERGVSAGWHWYDEHQKK